MPDTLLRCSKCREYKDPDAFGKSSQNKRGRNYQCRACYAQDWQERKRDPAVIERQRRNDVRKRYGITLEEYDALLAEGCSVCGDTSRMVLDHCHATNAIRAPLCGGCNSALGFVEDSPERLERLAAYLRRHRPTPFL